MKSTLKILWNELKVEASCGKVMIDKEEWPIAFNTIVYQEEKEKSKNMGEDSYPTLIIKQEETFLDLLEVYIKKELEMNRPTPKNYHDKERNHMKRLMAYLLVNASLEDFQDANNLLMKRISFLEDNYFKELEKGISVKTKILDSNLIIKKETNHTSMETPYRISFTMEKDGITYSLPDVYYGIYNNTCYIYSIMNPKTKKEESKEEKEYHNKMNRLLYKVNKGVSKKETQDYYDYIEGRSLFYPEDNITDVTHSFVLSLSIFMGLLQKEKIEEVKGVPYLPLRFLSREITSREFKDKEKELIERNEQIQTNLTNKFIRTFRRVAYHNEDVEIKTVPFEVDEFLSVHLNPKHHSFNNDLLNSATEGIKER